MDLQDGWYVDRAAKLYSLGGGYYDNALLETGGDDRAVLSQDATGWSITADDGWTEVVWAAHADFGDLVENATVVELPTTGYFAVEAGATFAYVGGTSAPQFRIFIDGQATTAVASNPAPIGGSAGGYLLLPKTAIVASGVTVYIQARSVGGTGAFKLITGSYFNVVYWP